MCFRRKKRGPIRYEQWTEAFTRPLSPDVVAYIKRGKCNNNIYPTLFNKFSDYITGSFNSALDNLNRNNGTSADLVFALKRLTAVYRISLFFRDLKWIKHDDKAALNDSLKNAAMATVAKLKPQAESNPDVLFESMMLARVANGET